MMQKQRIMEYFFVSIKKGVSQQMKEMFCLRPWLQTVFIWGQTDKCWYRVEKRDTFLTLA